MFNLLKSSLLNWLDLINFPCSLNDIKPSSNILSAFGESGRPLNTSIFSLSSDFVQGFIWAPINKSLFWTFVNTHFIPQYLNSWFLKYFCQVDDLTLTFNLELILDPVGVFKFWSTKSKLIFSPSKSVFKIILKTWCPTS
jgi:hypothetical protein